MVSHSPQCGCIHCGLSVPQGCGARPSKEHGAGYHLPHSPYSAHPTVPSQVNSLAIQHRDTYRSVSQPTAYVEHRWPEGHANVIAAGCGPCIIRNDDSTHLSIRYGPHHFPPRSTAPITPRVGSNRPMEGLEGLILENGPSNPPLGAGYHDHDGIMHVPGGVSFFDHNALKVDGAFPGEPWSTMNQRTDLNTLSLGAKRNCEKPYNGNYLSSKNNLLVDTLLFRSWQT